jgi:hypothetical protein
MKHTAMPHPSLASLALTRHPHKDTRRNPRAVPLARQQCHVCAESSSQCDHRHVGTEWRSPRRREESQTDRRLLQQAFLFFLRLSQRRGVHGSVQGARHPFHYGGLYPTHSYCFGHSMRRRVTELTDATAEFGIIPHDHLVPARVDR